MKPRLLALLSVVVLSAGVSLAQPSTQHAAGRLASMPGVKVFKNLEYGRGSGRALLLDLYLPENADKPLPLIIWIHGGAWSGGSKDNPGPALKFVRDGYAVAQVGYRLSPEAKFPAQIHDCKAAVRWLRANADQYHLNPNRFIAWGASAGGHLVSLLGVTSSVADLEGTDNALRSSSRVQAVIDWFGPTDLRSDGSPRAAATLDDPNGPVAKLFGGTSSQQKELAAKASPMAYDLKGAPPFLIMHGDQDQTVPVRQSVTFSEALKKAGVDVTYVLMYGSGHGFSGPQAIEPVEEFLKHCVPESH